MVLASDKLALAGPVNLGNKTAGILAYENEPEALAAFLGEKGILLQIVSAKDGEKLAECELDALPVFDGMSPADGKLYLSLQDGSVVCIGK